uniref:Uncharacterized protein n=1 Tax=Arundo donax TaxID=35708 RepID=A0A0A9C4C4_ARUDO
MLYELRRAIVACKFSLGEIAIKLLLH